MAIHIPPPRKWSHRHIILVALIGSLVVNAIAAAISISLSPAHIFFSIQNTAIGNKTDEDTMFYNFTLVANNSSPSMAVHYGALSAEIWYSETAWVPAVVHRSALLDEQPPGKPAYINVSAEYWQSEQTSTPPPPAGSGSGGGKDATPPPAAVAGEKDWSNCTVLVTASVWFKSEWWIGTRWYDVRANCSQVNFSKNSTTVRCK